MKFSLEDIKKYKNLELTARQLVEGFITGLHKSPYHGFSVEFSEHKQYNPGESTKNIDWKVFARTDKLFVKQFEEETNLRAHILIDTSSSMYFPAENNGKLAFSIYAAAALATLLQGQRDAVSLIDFNDKIAFQSDVKSTSIHLHQLMNYLSTVLEKPKTNVPTSTSEVLHTIAQKINKRGVVILFTDMFEQSDNLDDIFKGLQHLKHKKHELLIFHVVDRIHEVDFDYKNRPYIFIDNETGEKLKLTPTEIKESYKSEMQKFLKSVELRCQNYKIDYNVIDINEDFEKVLMSYFVKRRRMH